MCVTLLLIQAKVSYVSCAVSHFYETEFETWVLYMFSSFWLLGVESRDFSQAEKERTACKASHKMTTTSTQNGPRLLF